MQHSVLIKYPGDLAHTFYIDFDDNKTSSQILEEVFNGFNHGSGKEYPAFLKAENMRSLSVHDFVKLDDQWYQCCSVGWEKVTEEYIDEIREAVVGHPEYINNGPWFCLKDVMWTKYRKL